MQNSICFPACKMKSGKIKFIHKICKPCVLSAGGSIVYELEAISSGEPQPPPLWQTPSLVTTCPLTPTHTHKKLPHGIRVDKSGISRHRKDKMEFLNISETTQRNLEATLFLKRVNSCSLLIASCSLLLEAVGMKYQLLIFLQDHLTQIVSHYYIWEVWEQIGSIL